MNYAVLEINGFQYLADEGSTLLVHGTDPKKVIFNTLFVSDGSSFELGAPYVKKAKIDYKIEEKVILGKKIDVFKYKSKSRYRKRIGHREKLLNINIGKISI